MGEPGVPHIVDTEFEVVSGPRPDVEPPPPIASPPIFFLEWLFANGGRRRERILFRVVMYFLGYHRAIDPSRLVVPYRVGEAHPSRPGLVYSGWTKRSGDPIWVRPGPLSNAILLGLGAFKEKSNVKRRPFNWRERVALTLTAMAFALGLAVDLAARLFGFAHRLLSAHWPGVFGTY